MGKRLLEDDVPEGKRLRSESTEPTPVADLSLTKKEQAKLRAEENRVVREAAKLQKEEEKRQKEEQRRVLAEDRAEKKRLLELEKLEKKRKLEEERAEKKRAQEAEKEAKRLAAEEKKRAQEAEKEAKKRALEEKKRALEEKKKIAEEKKKAEEDEKRRKLEKEQRLQKNLMSFFKKKEPIASTETTTEELEYRKFFTPFNVRENTRLAKLPPIDDEITQRLDDVINGSAEPLVSLWLQNLNPITRQPTHAYRPPVEVEMTRGTDEFATAITQVGPIKFLSFYENNGRQYLGTWSAKIHQQQVLAVSPLNKIEGVDYDYDSDLDWEGDADDVDRESDEDDADDMEADDDDFVEQDQKQPFRPLGDELPKTILRADDPVYFRDFKVTVLVECATKIDPFAGALTSQATKHAEEAKLVSNTLGLFNNPNRLVAKKKIIADRNLVAKLIKFIDSEQEKAWPIGTLVDLALHHLGTLVKKLEVKETIKAVAERKPSWRVTDQARSDFGEELKKLDMVS